MTLRAISTSLQDALAAPGQFTPALCVRCEWADGTTVLGFTSYARPLEVDGVVYQSAPGAAVSQVTSNAGLEVDTLEAQLVRALSGGVQDADVLAGKWNGCRSYLFLVNAEDLTQGVVKLRTGWVGEITLDRGGVRVEHLGLMQHYQSSIGKSVTPQCQNVFCGPLDPNGRGCGLDIADFTYTGVVTGWDPDLAVVDSVDFAGFADHSFTDGTLVFDAQPWITFGIRWSFDTDGILALKQFPPFTVTPGDAITVTKGCRKDLETCRDVFSNVVRFNGFPYVKGTDMAVRFGRHDD